MMTVRTRLIALAIAICIVPAFAQTPPATDPHKPAAPKAEPAKPAPAPAPTKEAPKADAAKPAATASAASAKVGSPAPDFKLKDTDGKERSLSEFKGKIVVLEWSNAGCPVCVRHAKAKTAEKTVAAYKDKGVVWLNIDSTNGVDTKVDAVKTFAKDHGITAPYLLDPTGATGKAYGAKTTPHMFVIDAKGTLAYSGAIDDDNDGSKGDKAKNYVKDALDALVKGSTVATATTEPYGCSVKYKG